MTSAKVYTLRLHSTHRPTEDDRRGKLQRKTAKEDDENDCRRQPQMKS